MATMLSNHRRRERGAQSNNPSGKIATQICRPNISWPLDSIDEATEAVETPVCTVTEIVAVPPNGALDGCSKHVELAGAPVQDNTAVPGTPAAEERSSGYTADVPLLTVTLVLPSALKLKSIPVPVNATVCGEFAALFITVKVPVLAPPTVGPNTTCTTQACPAAKVAPHPFVKILKSPVTAKLPIVSTELPLLVRVIAIGAELSPTPTAPNDNPPSGASDTPAGATPTPFKVTA